MNPVQRFFRRYIFSTIGILTLFFVVNIALVLSVMIAGYMAGNLPDGQSVICPAHVSGDHNAQNQRDVDHEEQRQNANGRENVATEKTLHWIHDFAPFKLSR